MHECSFKELVHTIQRGSTPYSPWHEGLGAPTPAYTLTRGGSRRSTTKHNGAKIESRAALVNRPPLSPCSQALAGLANSDHRQGSLEVGGGGRRDARRERVRRRALARQHHTHHVVVFAVHDTVSLLWSQVIDRKGGLDADADMEMVNTCLYARVGRRVQLRPCGARVNSRAE